MSHHHKMSSQAINLTLWHSINLAL